MEAVEDRDDPRSSNEEGAKHPMLVMEPELNIWIAWKMPSTACCVDSRGERTGIDVYDREVGAYREASRGRWELFGLKELFV
jgi:hypothetical protein